MSKRLTLLSLCLGLFLAQTDTTAVNLALPAIGESLHGSLADLQWVIDAYNVAFAALLLTGGTLGDRFGRRRLFRCGIAVFVAGSLACALAPGTGVLVAARAMQGAGGALAIPQSLALLAVVFPGRRERNRAMAAWSTVTGVALASGPVLGGFLVERAGWPAIFWLNVPVGLAALGLTFAVPESADGRPRGIDVPGQLLAVLFLGALTYAAVQTGVVPGVVAVLAGAAFVLVERRERAMLPLALLRRGQLRVAAVVALCMTFGMYGFLLLASLHLQQVRHADPLHAGLQLLPLPAMVVLGSPLTGRLVNRIGPRPAMAAGMTLMGGGLTAFALAGPTAPLPYLEVVFAVLGAGLALNTGPVVNVAVSAVSPDRAGLAAGVVNLARMFGAALGVAVLGVALAAAGLRAALAIGAAVELAGALVAWFGVQSRERKAAEVDTAGLDESAPSSSAENAKSSR
ncbi:MFS transporter [Amycolatopsis acidiphila]|uniref:MFS transporter n=1 Tax=Amycolatopsis acidiphila TaxID=715473 RepID=A0A558ABE3_9PSEU|nr:MFS transporter [Amycolatopsis acidiphila]TVT21586.1 MFS transporter [Amycolatopsis acidiphila]UIJ62164.1 MFS transporter [Amycolatopsis acidiphila]GHG92205.1 MFS transporter [Amycolatopsis acidiphila]